MTARSPFERLRPPLPNQQRAGLPRVLVAGVYLTDTPTNVEAISRELAGATRYRVVQRWIALGDGEPPLELRAHTAFAVPGPGAKYALLHRLVTRSSLGAYDYLLLCDDDVGLPAGFLDRFLHLQRQVDFRLAQPARTASSFIDHSIVQQQEGVLARQTRFVESGPVVSVHRSAYDLVLPFDLTSPMGWGYEYVWAYRLSRAGLKMGILDGVALEHRLRPPAAHYSAPQAYEDQLRLLSRQPHLPIEECYRVLSVIQP